MKKRNKILLIILSILVVIAVVIGVLAYINRDMISTMYYVMTTDKQQIEQEKEYTDERALEAVKDFGVETINPLTEEQAEKLKNGELSEEEAIDIVLGKTEETSEGTSSNGSSSEKPNGSSTTSQGTKDSATNKDNNKVQSAQSEELKKKNEEISRLIGELYVLKAEFSGELSAIENWVNDQYWKYTQEYDGNIPSSVKVKIGRKAYADALALEDSCDVEFYAILDRIEVLLKETGQSTTLVSEMRAAYDSEKKAAISYYMDQF